MFAVVLAAEAVNWRTTGAAAREEVAVRRAMAANARANGVRTNEWKRVFMISR
jgi:hypothetical protein